MSSVNDRCSFCKKSRQEAGALVKGAHGAICGACTDKAQRAIERHRAKQAEEAIFEMVPPREIKDFLDEYVIGQELAKRALSVAVYDHYLRVLDASADFQDDTEIEKANIMLIGPTGCGKTLLAKTIARMLNVPFTIADATRLTEAGFVGDDVEDILTPLVSQCGGDPRRIERSIVFIDEIDKITAGHATNTMVRDVRGRGVQQALLKLLEGSKVRVPLPGHRRLARAGDGQAELEIDTSNILFIVGGAFPGLDKIIEKRVNKKGAIGFGGKDETSDNIEGESNLLQKVDTEDLKTFGLIPEFLGRIPCVVTLEELTVDEMVRVLTEPRNAIVKQKVREMSIGCGVTLTFEDDALRAIAEVAKEDGRGARGLRSIIEPILRDVKFDLPSERGQWDEVIVTRACVENEDTQPTKVPAQAEATG